MLKRGFAFALALVMLVSVASAVEAVTPDGDTYEVSAWALLCMAYYRERKKSGGQ